MGGKAFSTEGLHMPRMPPDIYHQVLAQVQTQLRRIYAEVKTPIEGPAKADHGDVDVLVVLGEGQTEPDSEDVMNALGAAYRHRTRNSATTHYALRWPEGDEEEEVGSESGTGEKPRFIQVDVHLCPDVAELEYTYFQHSHGDFWIILGVIIRRFGFLTTSSGLYYRIVEIEPLSKLNARVKLTDEPDRVLRYLGLDAERFWGVFAGWDEVMEYLGTCRFHDPGRGRQYDDEEVADKPDVKAHDRSKSGKRPMFRYWLTSYLPAHRDDEVGSAGNMTQEEVVEDVKSFFGEEVGREIDDKRTAGMKIIALQKLWSDIRKALPCSGSDLTYAMKGLKLEISGEPPAGNTDELKHVREAFTNGQYDDIKKWAAQNWEAVKDRQVQRDRAMSTSKLLGHLEKQKALASEEVAQEDG